MIISMADGSSLRPLSRGSGLRVICKCDTPECGKTWPTQYFHAIGKVNHRCRSCVAKGKRRRKHWTEDQKRLISDGVKRSERFNEVVRSKEFKEKVGKASRGRRHSEATKAKLSAMMIGNRRSGGESGGRCKWYSKDNNGTTQKVQGTWELAYVQYLLREGVRFVAHPTPPLFYSDISGQTRRYFPDFLLLDTKEYVDVKNPFCLKQDMEKIKAIQEQGVCLTVITGADLVTMGLLTRGGKLSRV